MQTEENWKSTMQINFHVYLSLFCVEHQLLLFQMDLSSTTKRKIRSKFFLNIFAFLLLVILKYLSPMKVNQWVLCFQSISFWL